MTAAADSAGDGDHILLAFPKKEEMLPPRPRGRPVEIGARQGALWVRVNYSTTEIVGSNASMSFAYRPASGRSRC